MDYVYKFPVVRGIQAKREYFIAMVPLKMLPRLFPIDDEYVLPEYRAQRKLNEARIPVISKYILDNRDSYVFSALAASIDGDFCFNRLQQERSSINSTVITKSTEYSRDIEIFLQKLELHDDSERMMKYSNIALRILEAYAVELQRRKTGTLGATITKCYKQLANKKNLIQEIVMNSETLDMQYLDENGNEVSKESLSAGEKQLMVIAILWALALCSKKKLPVIIDTPLSRMDSQHRTSIISTYFPNASDQTIILSTDTEIDQNYYEMMKNSVGDEFTLVYSEETKSTSIKKGYFQEL